MRSGAKKRAEGCTRPGTRLAKMVDIESRIKEFGTKLEEAEEDGTDPLSVWCSHLEWMEANKLTRHDCYKKALQQCAQYFSWSSMAVYKGDMRLAMVYLKMAKICKDPVVIYKHMLENNIGTYCALFYDTYAVALGEQGKVDEAVKLVKQGLAQNAQPMKKLQKRLDLLKQSPESQGGAPTLSAAVTTSKTERQTASSTWQDEQSERNDAFYHKPGIKYCYPKSLVYPRGGGEVSLEHVRASQPQYTPSFLEDQEDDCDMDLTLAHGGHITTCIPVVPNFFKPGAKQLAMNSGNKVLSVDHQEHSAFKLVKRGENEREPRSHHWSSTFDDELEVLCAEKDQELLQRSLERSGLSTRTRDKSEKELESEFEKQMEQLMLEKESPAQMLTVGKAADQSDDFRHLENQENQPREVAKPSAFDFTPGTMEGGVYWQVLGQKSGGGGFINTKLNFSEADSTFGGDEQSSRHQLSSSFGRVAFNSTLDLERRTKITEEQLKFESEFANTEINVPWKRSEKAPPSSCQVDTSSFIDPSFSDSQSFEVFRDHSRNASRGDLSYGANVSGLRGKMNDGSFVTTRQSNVKKERRPLQEIRVPDPQPLSDFSVDHTSYATSQSSISSFSVFEDESCAEQSSFAPFHDSWSTAPSAAKNVSGREQVGREYLAPLEAPVMKNEKRVGLNQTMEQTFTQFDIKHPSNFEPVSTPMGVRCANTAALSWDVSVIPDVGSTELEVFQPSQKPRPQPHPHPPPSQREPVDLKPQIRPSSIPRPVHEAHLKDSLPTKSKSSAAVPRQGDEGVLAFQEKSNQQQLGCPFNLSTITEESGSFKSSSSGSRLTISSASSNSHHSGLSAGTPHSQLLQHTQEDVNPFEQHIVNMMLNTLSLPVGRMEKISGNFPRVVSGQSLDVGGECYSNVKKLTEGGFATIYVGDHNGQTDTLKVQSPALEWELAVVDELRSRLTSRGLDVWMDSFLEVKKAFQFSNASVLIMSYFPQGSLLDLVNSFHAGRVHIPECVVLYYCCEVLSVVAALHQCGIIHADLKPDNFMVRDLRPFTSTQQFNIQSIRGKGVCLIDFGCAIDTQVFPEDTMFVGSSETDAFQCPAMIEERPWKWQADYYCLAATMHVLINQNYMKVQQDATSGLYKPTSRVNRKFDTGLWSKLFEVLLNSSEVLPLTELVRPLEEKLKQQKSVLLRRHMSSAADTLNKYKLN